MENNRKKGTMGESMAARLLEEKGYRIVDRNVLTKSGEIDLLAYDGKTLVFVEVKTRWSNRYGSPKEAITAVKKTRMVRAALQYLTRHGKMEIDFRFDVVSILLNERNELVDWELIQNIPVESKRYFL